MKPQLLDSVPIFGFDQMEPTWGEVELAIRPTFNFKQTAKLKVSAEELKMLQPRQSPDEIEILSMVRTLPKNHHMILVTAADGGQFAFATPDQGKSIPFQWNGSAWLANTMISVQPAE